MTTTSASSGSFDPAGTHDGSLSPGGNLPQRLTLDPQLVDRVHRALDRIRSGHMVILVDDEDRENEGDLCMAADQVTPEAINFMAAASSASRSKKNR